MIRFIAAIDSKRGIANDHGIPWDLPTDKQFYRDAIKNDDIIMGMGTYRELKKLMSTKRNIVASKSVVTLQPGYELTTDAHAELEKYKNTEKIIWNTGGAQLFASTIDLADELYLTLIDKDFQCTKFFPEYEQQFEMVREDEPITENGATFRITVWRRKK